MQNADAYEVLVKEHEGMLIAYIQAIVRDHALAQDIAQETFLHACQKLSTLRERRAFGRWIRTIGRNMAIDHLRGRERTIFVDPDFIEGVEDVLTRLDDVSRGEVWAERVKALQVCYGRLPEDFREPCRLFYYDSRPSKEIAKLLNLRVETVKKRLERARKALKGCIEKILGLEPA